VECTPIYNCASSLTEIKTETLKNTWNKLISNKEPEFDIEGKEDDSHGAFGADPSDVRDQLNKVKDDFKHQNLTKEEIAQQAEEDHSSEDEECKVQIFRSETKLGLHHQFCGL
jgi:hypothetical protein